MSLSDQTEREDTIMKIKAIKKIENGTIIRTRGGSKYRKEADGIVMTALNHLISWELMEKYSLSWNALIIVEDNPLEELREINNLPDGTKLEIDNSIYTKTPDGIENKQEICSWSIVAMLLNENTKIYRVI